MVQYLIVKANLVDFTALTHFYCLSSRHPKTGSIYNYNLHFLIFSFSFLFLFYKQFSFTWILNIFVKEQILKGMFILIII